MIEFSMTNHSADPNQTCLAQIRKLIHFTVRIQKMLKNCKSQKNIFFRSVIMLKLTAPKQNSQFTIILRYADPKNFDADPDLIYTKHADPKSRIGTKHETVPENVKGMVITSWYGTVPH